MIFRYVGKNLYYYIAGWIDVGHVYNDLDLVIGVNMYFLCLVQATKQNMIEQMPQISWFSS